MSLWADYKREREGKQVYEEKDGFVVYSFPSSVECYIEDIYVIPEKRKTGYATKLADYVCEIARKKGCEHLLGSVWVGSAGDTTSMKVLLGYGMHLLEVRGNLIIFTKELVTGNQTVDCKDIKGN